VCEGGGTKQPMQNSHIKCTIDGAMVIQITIGNVKNNANQTIIENYDKSTQIFAQAIVFAWF
jgi:hypothetical protein